MKKQSLNSRLTLKHSLRAGLGILTLTIAACGGGGSGSSSANNTVASASTPMFEAGVFPNSDNFKSQCENPRSGSSAVTGIVFDDRDGSTLDENFWLRSWTNETYYWYEEVVDLDPGLFTTPEYFELLRTEEITASGKDKDEFHFTVPTDEWEALSQTGISVSYGAQLAVLSPRVPREIVVAFTDPQTPASFAGLARGDRVLSIDGVDINTNSSAGIATLNAGLAPNDIGEQHVFVLQSLDGRQYTAELTAETINNVSVQNVSVHQTEQGAVGYFLFNDHIATSEAELVAAFNQLSSQNVDDLVLDLRYNGGGFLAIASQVAYMIAGPRTTANRTFERLQFNDKHPTFNPVTGELNEPLPFFDETVGFSLSPGQPLPSLNLSRVFVLTTDSTCSASESILNSLRGIGVEVIQIGTTTCGKPYGFYATDNCGTTYFSVQFQSVNALGFGDYADGFAPLDSQTLGAVLLPGCVVNDDFDHALGDPEEAMFAQALQYQQFGRCATVAAGTSSKSTDKIEKSTPLVKNPWQENRILNNPNRLSF